MSEAEPLADQGADDAVPAPPGADVVRAWAGYRLDEIGGAGVGKVDGLFVDAESGAPEWLVARMGRFGHHTLIPGRDAVEGVKRVWVPYGRDKIRSAPKADPSAPLNAGAERALLAHYGIMADAGRGKEIAERGDSETTARPG